MTTISIEQEARDSLAQVVARVIGRDVTRGELSKAFDRVADRSNWKNPIDATVDISGDFELLSIREAVIFFTGSEPTFTAVRPTVLIGNDGLPSMLYRVRAAGYYKAVGA